MARYATGAWFAGVYNVSAGSLVLCPSGDTTYADGTVPDPRVLRRGGHAVLQELLNGLVPDGGASNVGFAVQVVADGSLTVYFRSGVVNRTRYRDLDAPAVFEGLDLHRPVVSALTVTYLRRVTVGTPPPRP